MAGPARVLLVDGEPGAAILMAQLLRATWAEGLVIAHADRIEEATHELRGHGASCVLLSIRTPEDIRSLAYMSSTVPGVPIVAVGDRDDEVLALRAVSAGAQDYLSRGELHATRLRRALTYAMERNRSEVRLAHEALHDPLTGLPNRVLFFDRLEVALDRSQRTGSTLALLFLDVDKFKDINDSLGHAGGDRILEVLAERLRAMLRPMDTVARLGGDEFTLLFEELAGEREALLIAERLSRSIEVPIPVGDGEALITASIGIALASGKGIAPDALIRDADVAMYRAKANGRSRFELFDESLRRRGMERIELEKALRYAVERSELRVHYQPRVSLNDPWRLTGFEALVRWKHPERGLIAPKEFMPVAEETGLVLPIGEYVFEQALSQFGRWQATRPGLTLSINLSARQVQDGDLARALTHAMNMSGTDPRSLCLEIAEKALMQDPEVSREELHVLKATGITLAIDDYGTGYSSLSNLRQLPIDTIKIHESFVGDLGREPKQESLVRAMVDLAHALGLGTVAEGVETHTQLTHLRRLGCDRGQGFLFGRPVPADAAEALLARN